ncbi:hypothetical protein [Streptomyces sp. BE133]|uniref:hypothetical protein n=1 Tax=Streptomyces sp. BE133 TaxID=3002523 RepID=UPI002E765F28|nr:hypothetical protein [Streptomyces sp. BE133]MEE1808255.1 hypothetical protein [Streptomyces sp. BE133]
MTNHAQPPADPYQDVPTTVVFDEFSETATTLTGLYNGRAKGAATAEEREEWWSKAMVLRDACRAVRAHDRDQLIEHIALWTRKIEELESSERG